MKCWSVANNPNPMLLLNIPTYSNIFQHRPFYSFFGSCSPGHPADLFSFSGPNGPTHQTPRVAVNYVAVEAGNGSGASKLHALNCFDKFDMTKTRDNQSFLALQALLHIRLKHERIDDVTSCL